MLLKKSVYLAATIVLFFCGCQGQNKTLYVSPEELSENFEEHSDKIWDLVAYTNDALKDYCGIQLIIKDSIVTELYVYNFLWMGTKNPKQKDFDKLLHIVGFNDNTIKTIVRKLIESNCRSIELMKDDGWYIKVLYKADERCGYYYRLFREDESDASIQKMIDEEPILIPYSNRVLFEYNPYKNNMDPTFPGREEYLRNYSTLKK